ncbi:hypothetical protein AYO21_01183 [Fonsecaea monophora]|uniref:F-box domain-containing protein n=1 Tax=Fonsecaea monophora TaxID=254056 RepID=A0A177FK52_9EURO|nr:hypothetical protein AYO21_01183 [Fonsecaea monophora]KAH0841582.1 hypothetical protein FOPE_06809 [Fonsecaea pedrosoi]OAG44693.1 hypothetical protein AYO21_01183 [Fonsecaea monophora]
MLNQFPLEVLVHVLFFLDRDHLQAVRLVNRALASKVGPVLFRTIHVSYLTLHRLVDISHHPTLCQAVEELRYQEFNFDINVDDEPWNQPETPLAYRLHTNEGMTSMIAEFVAKRKKLAIDYTGEDSEASGLDEGDTALAEAEQRPSDDDIRDMISAVRGMYADTAHSQKHHFLYGFFREIFQRLPNLRRVICVEAETEVDCLALDSSCLEQMGALKRLRQVFPLPDYGVRSWLQPDVRHWPSHGFMGAWRALSDPTLDTGIQHLEIRRNSNLFLQRGVFVQDLGPDTENLEHGFRNLTVLCLCLEVRTLSPLNAIPHAQVLATALARASNLRRLELCFMSYAFSLPSTLGTSYGEPTHVGIPFGDADRGRDNVLPFVSFPHLDTLVLEEADFTADQICAWLFMQPRLRHLVLRRPYLRGRWEDVVEKWSSNPDFTLDSLELVSPWDHDNRDLGEDTQHMDRVQVPARVSSGAVLDFVKRGGTNPFARRRWKLFCGSEGRTRDLDASATATDATADAAAAAADDDDNLDAYSDISEWLPADHPTPVEDPDGPEFDEDYDFDAERDSDMDMDMTL